MKGRGIASQVVWVSSSPPGVEHCTVNRSASGWFLKGTLVRRFREGTALITYLIETDLLWRTRRVGAEQVFGGKRQSLKMEVRHSRWFRGGKEVQALRGCADVDLEASPVTNSLPIKRARRRKELLELTAAWLRFPSFEAVPLRQRYDRLGPGRYKYTSATGFTAELEIDSFELVRRYGDYWIAVGSMPS